MKKPSSQSTVILLGIATLLVTVIVERSAIKEFVSNIYRSLSNWLASPVTIPLWLILVLLLLLLLGFGVAFLWLKEKFCSSDYTRDCFDKYSPIVFQWDNDSSGICDITPRCPIDLTELIFQPMLAASRNRVNEIDGCLDGFQSRLDYRLFCPTCHKEYKTLLDEQARNVMIRYTELQIDAYQQDARWKKASRRIKKAKKIAKKS